MGTTVAVKEETRELLKAAQRELETSTFDETIRKLVLNLQRPKQSLRGLAKHTPEFVREEIDRFA